MAVGTTPVSAATTPTFVLRREKAPIPVFLPRLADPRLHLAAVIITIQVLGQTALGFHLSVAQILLTIGTCALIEVVATFGRDHALVWPASAMLTGNGIALVLRVPGTEHGDWWSTFGWQYFVGVAVVAMLSKYLIRRNGRHIFNPSNVAVVAVVGVAWLLYDTSPVDLQVLWWGPLSTGLTLTLAVIVIGALAVTRRVGMVGAAAAFWIAFAVASAPAIAAGHCIEAPWHLGDLCGRSYWTILVTSPEVLIFLLFMITDPKTTPATRPQRLAFGAFVGVVAAVLVAPQPTELLVKLALLGSLVVGCLARPLVERAVPASATSVLDAVHDRPRGRLQVAAMTTVVVAIIGVVAVVQPDRPPALAAPPSLVTAADLPPVHVSEQAAQFDPPIEQAAAEQIALDFVNALAVEAMAIDQGDADLARLATAGTRLRAIETAIADGRQLRDPTPEFTDLTVTVVRATSQSVPQVAVLTVSESPNGTPTETQYVVDRTGGHLRVAAPIPALTGAPASAPIATVDVPALPRSPASAEAESAAGDLRFVDITSAAGLRTVGPSAGGTGRHTGVAAEDYDGDGDIDLYLSRAGRANVLYENDGSGRFTDVTVRLGATGERPLGTADGIPIWADVDGDGHLDLFVSAGEGRDNVLYLQRNGLFVDETDGRGLGTRPTTTDPSGEAGRTGGVSAAVGDVDGDGDLDLVTAQWHTLTALHGTDASDACARRDDPTLIDDHGNSRLYLNDGTGHFDDATERWGFDLRATAARQPVFADHDGDGDPDLFVTGDWCTSRLFRNDGDRFVDVTAGAGVGTDEAGSASMVADIDGDGVLDWTVSSISYSSPGVSCPPILHGACSGNRAYLGDGEGGFVDRTDELGVRAGYWGQGGAVADFDLDGHADLFQLNGITNASEYFDSSPNRLWMGSAAGPSVDAAAPVGLASTAPATAVAVFDLEGDGDLDLFVAAAETSSTLWRNDLPSTGRWVEAVLTDSRSPDRRAIGARLEITLDDGTIVRDIRASGAYANADSTVLHAGLGTRVTGDRVTAAITWPDGAIQSVSLRLGAVTQISR